MIHAGQPGRSRPKNWTDARVGPVSSKPDNGESREMKLLQVFINNNSKSEIIPMLKFVENISAVALRTIICFLI